MLTKYDLSDDGDERAEKRDGEMLNEDGEVRDEFFEAAVARAVGRDTEVVEDQKARAERMIETRKDSIMNFFVANGQISFKFNKKYNIGLTFL